MQGINLQIRMNKNAKCKHKNQWHFCRMAAHNMNILEVFCQQVLETNLPKDIRSPWEKIVRF